MADIELFQQGGRNAKPNVWRAWVAGNKVHVEWGQQGGKMQKTVQEHAAVNEGKANARTPAQAAKDALARTVRLKRREGYMEELTTELPASIDFDSLPERLCFYKPQTSLSAGLTKIADAGNAIFTRKRDGEMFALVVNTKGEVDIYSRRMHRSHDDEKVPWHKRFPQIVNSVEALGLPPRTILLCEMIFDDNGKDNFTKVTNVTRALTDKALAFQKKEGYLQAYVWDVAFIDGAPCCVTEPYEKRLEWIHARIKGKGLIPVEFEKFKNVQAALDAAKKRKIEGWVVVNGKGIYEDRAFNMKGKPDRPVHSGKLKPLKEGDFLVDWDPDEEIGEWGTGNRAKGIGSVACFALKEGELTYVGNCGSGISLEQAHKWKKKHFPMVWEIAFASWTPKSMLFQPRFERVREDKTADEIHTMGEEDVAAE